MYNWQEDREKTVDNIRLIILCIVFFLLSIFLIYRIFVLQIVNGEETLENFTLQIQRERTIPSTRGNIYDRNGVLLAYNELAYNVTIEDIYESGTTKNSELNNTLLEVIKIIESNDDKVDNEFNIIIDEDGNFAFNLEGTRLLRFLADIYGKTNIYDLDYSQETATAQEVIDYLSSYGRYGIGISKDPLNPRDSFVLGEGFTKKEILQIVSIRYAMSANNYQRYISTIIATNVSMNTVVNILENTEELLGISIEEDTVRVYNDSVYFSQILGYTGKISQEELDSLNTELDETEDLTYINQNKENYILTDRVGKIGIEQTMETYLQGKKGYETVYVDNLGKVIETTERVEAVAGNDLYLTLDYDLQKAIYNIVEQKLAGILVSKIINSKTYTIPANPSANTLKIPIDDVYFALIDNSVIDINHFFKEDAKTTEIAVKEAFIKKKEAVFSMLTTEMQEKKTAYRNLSTEFQNYQSYIITMLNDQGVIKTSEIDTSDATYIAWRTDETISMAEYLSYCISMNWIDVTKLELETTYSDSNEIFNCLLKYILNKLDNNTAFAKKMYRFMIQSNIITGRQVCLILLEQGIVDVVDEMVDSFTNSKINSYQFIIWLIENLHITPGQLALDPYSASVVVTNVEGEVIALVSYPSYDNNRLANSIDSEYYAKLQSDLSRPMWNYATQQRTAPGSTYKMVSTVAGLEEGIITTNTTVQCRGIFDRFSTNQYKCWIYPSAHGSLNVQGAIAHSCNSFFYEVGYQLGIVGDTYSSDVGIEKLSYYASLFGLNEKSGVEIEESQPELSTNYSVLSAIGQGNNNFTTVGLARYTTTIATKGKNYQLSLIDKVTDSSGNLLVEYSPTLVNELELSSSEWNSIFNGMKEVVEKRSDYSDLSITVAGKTGTAQENLKRANHALFVSFAPYENPEITITTRVAFGYSSTYAANITRDIYQYYFGLDEADAILTGTAEIPDTTITTGD
ncbi:MAG: penicillin-binding transpeptidase domain-containing protein [Lachnospiraceae bacterium]